jgi:hypothetical protein
MPLPKLDLAVTHFISAVLTFPANETATAELVFGGPHGFEVSSINTAVPIVWSRRPPSSIKPAAFSGIIRHQGQTLDVLAVDTKTTDLIVVVDASAESLILRGSSRSFRRAIQAKSAQIFMDRIRPLMSLGSEHSFRLLIPEVRPTGHPRFNSLLFGISPFFGGDDGAGMLWALNQNLLMRSGSEQRLTEAVAVAGMTAAAGGRKRAVLLVLGSAPGDTEDLKPEAVRTYLGSLGVPLIVWAPENGTGPWGPMRSIATRRLLEKSVADLRDFLDRQLVLWVAGHHPYHELTLALGSQAPQISLVDN